MTDPNNALAKASGQPLSPAPTQRIVIIDGQRYHVQTQRIVQQDIEPRSAQYQTIKSRGVPPQPGAPAQTPLRAEPDARRRHRD